jgi:hypothetical protein
VPIPGSISLRQTRPSRTFSTFQNLGRHRPRSFAFALTLQDCTKRLSPLPLRFRIESNDCIPVDVVVDGSRHSDLLFDCRFRMSRHKVHE